MWVIVQQDEKEFAVGHYVQEEVRPDAVGPSIPLFLALHTYTYMIDAIRLVNVLNGGDGNVPNNMGIPGK